MEKWKCVKNRAQRAWCGLRRFASLSYCRFLWSVMPVNGDEWRLPATSDDTPPELT